MSVTIKNLFQKITTEEVGVFETEFKLMLPGDYRQFLIEHNGGMPSPNVFYINEEEGESNLSIFYGFVFEEEKYRIYDLRRNYQLFESNGIYLPIGRDSGGNKICLCLNDKSYGKIYFWDHENPSQKNLYLVAESFEEFLVKLH